jgi:hypothetical protein|uniref:Uncharacterized protein n=1 Tax=Eutreptiella gymnastica TaxID=73025 RepID=A0A7S4G5K6_9EUGL|mmetsp:Transcript_60241/g.99512  ORF Transcript_60241/g.99512 Transcript_60241/m.99512 type:complete len:125 (-) Transcript_60241:60-434(-)
MPSIEAVSDLHTATLYQTNQCYYATPTQVYHPMDEESITFALKKNVDEFQREDTQYDWKKKPFQLLFPMPQMISPMLLSPALFFQATDLTNTALCSLAFPYNRSHQSCSLQPWSWCAHTIHLGA